MKFDPIYIVFVMCMSFLFSRAETCTYAEGPNNNNWKNASNWSCNKVPDESTDSVIIPVGQEVNLNQGVVIKDANVLLVHGKVDGGNEGIFLFDDASLYLFEASELTNTGEIKLEGRSYVWLESKNPVELLDLNVFSASFFNIGTKISELKVKRKLIVSNDAKVSGEGKLTYQVEDINSGVNEFRVEGRLFNCEGFTFDVSSSLALELSSETCAATTSNLTANNDVACLTLNDKVEIQVQKNDFLGSDTIKNNEIQEVNIIRIPRYGKVIQQLQVGNFKITYQATDSLYDSRPSTDTIQYEIIAKTGDRDTAFIVITFPEVKNLTNIELVCREDLPKSLFELYGLNASEINNYKWFVNDESSELSSDSLVDNLLTEYQNLISFYREDNQGCVEISVDEIEYINTNPNFRLVSNEYCTSSVLARESINAEVSNGQWSWNGQPIFVAQNIYGLSNNGTFELKHTVSERGCSDNTQETIIVAGSPRNAYDPLPDTICKYSNPVILDRRVLGNSSSFSFTVNNEEKPILIPFTEPSPISISFIDNSGSCTYTGFQSVQAVEQMGIRDTIDTLIVSNRIYEQRFPSFNNRILFPRPEVSISRSIEGDSLKIFVLDNNVSDQFIVVKKEGFTCPASTIYNIFFEDELVIDAGPDITTEELGSDSFRAPSLSYGTGTWSINSSTTQLVVNDLNDAMSTFDVGNAGEVEMRWSVVTPGGQSGEDFMTVIVKEKEIRFPEAFSPNGDGLNDTYRIENLDPKDKIELNVLNRWGQVLYSTEDYLKDGPWAGKDSKSKDLPADTYIVNITLNGEAESVAVLLKR